MLLRSPALLSPRFLLALLLALLAAGCSNGGSTADTKITFNPLIYLGTWTGTWTNTTTSATGAVNIVVEQEGADLTIEFDMDGEVFGVDDPEPETFTARILPQEARMVSVRSDVYGMLTGNVTGDATINAAGTAIPGSIDRFLLTGTTNGIQMTANVTIRFDSGYVETANAILFKS